jgi:hypothetical protein
MRGLPSFMKAEFAIVPIKMSEVAMQQGDNLMFYF